MKHTRTSNESMTDDSRKNSGVISALETRENSYHKNASGCSDTGEIKVGKTPVNQNTESLN